MPARSRRDLPVEVTCNVVVLFCATCIVILWAPVGFPSCFAHFLSIFFLQLFVGLVGVLPRSACPCLVLIDYFRRQRRRPHSRQQSPEASAASTRRVAQRRHTHSPSDVQCELLLKGECSEPLLIPLSPASSARKSESQSEPWLIPLSPASSARTCELQSEPWLIPLSAASSARRCDAARKACAPLYSLSETRALLKEPSAPSKRSGLVQDQKRRTVSRAFRNSWKLMSPVTANISFEEFRKAIRLCCQSR